MHSLYDDLREMNSAIGKVKADSTKLSSDMADVIQSIKEADSNIDTTPLNINLGDVSVGLSNKRFLHQTEVSRAWTNNYIP